MTALFIGTRKVRHIGVWVTTPSVPAGADARHYRSGGFRAICGQATHVSAVLVFPRDLSPDAEQLLGAAFVRQLRAALRRPVCRGCARTAATIAALLEPDGTS